MKYTDFLRIGKVFHVRTLLGQKVFNLWLLLSFLNLKICLLTLILVSQLLLHLETAFPYDEDGVDWFIFYVDHLSSLKLYFLQIQIEAENFLS